MVFGADMSLFCQECGRSLAICHKYKHIGPCGIKWLIVLVLGLMAGLSQGEMRDCVVLWVEGRDEAVNASGGDRMKKA